jgi:spore germination protein
MDVIKRIVKSLSKSNERKQANNQQQMPPSGQDPLLTDLNENVQTLRTIYTNCPDVVFRPFVISGKTNAMLLYISGLSNIELIDQHVLHPLMQQTVEEPEANS